MGNSQFRSTTCCFYVIQFLGLWLIAGALTFIPTDSVFVRNELLCGALLFGLGFFSRCPCVPWLVCLIGIWLEAAPLLFSTPHISIYLNETLVGILIIAFSILIPEFPSDRESSLSMPPGWSYNPSSWPQRLPIAFLALIGWFCSRYLAAYQLGYIDQVWDPFFHNGTRDVITSQISKDFPVSDAGLGAFAYTLEMLLSLQGSSSRWRTIPWLVILFGILVVPLSAVSIILVILQPLVIGEWCFLCLLTAACMLVMLPLAIDEVVAVLQLLKRGYRRKESLWSLLWKGEAHPMAKLDTRTPSIAAPRMMLLKAGFWGVSLSWSLLGCLVLGIVLLSMPHNVTSRFFISDHIIGALVLVVTAIATAEVVRYFRFANLVFGCWIVLFSCIDLPKLSFDTAVHIIVGILLILLSLPQGKIHEKYGNGLSI